MKRLPKVLIDNFGRMRIHVSAPNVMATSITSRPHVHLVVLIALSVFVCEALLMFMLSYLPGLPTWLQALIDATLLVFLLSPVLYFGPFKTLVKYIHKHRQAEEIIKKQRDSLEQQVSARTAELSAFNAMLKREIAERQRAEEALQKAKDELEFRVKERTAELQQANEKLRNEIDERIRFQNQLEHSKSMLQAVVDGISDPLVLIDRDMRVKLLNRAAVDYYRVPKYDEIVGSKCHRVLREQFTPCEGCGIPAAISGGKSTLFERKGFMDPDRRERVYIYPVKGKAGLTDDVLMRINDITEQRLF